MKRIRAACAAGYERMAARTDLLDQINVFPVADADTGVNLRLSLAPLRDAASEDAQCLARLQSHATGNSGNIAVAFFTPLLGPPDPSDTKAGTAGTGLHSTQEEVHTKLTSKLAAGNRLARQAVLAPKNGTMLDLLEHLASFHNTAVPLPAGHNLVEDLAETVRATAQILPQLRQAGVVDAGALGLFFFFEGFFATYLQDTSLLRPAHGLFPGLLKPKPLLASDEDKGLCISLTLESNTNRDARDPAQAEPAVLAQLGSSVVVRRDGSTLRLHLHSQTPEKVQERLQDLGTITRWHTEPISLQQHSRPAPGLLHLLCDAAGSLSRTLAQQEGISLLDSYVICDGEAKPETLWDPATIYSALRQGKKVSTAQASVFERQQLFASNIELYGPALYLCVGSAYTGNHGTALAWKQEHDTKDQFTVVDSGAASGRLACIALMAARANRRVATKEALLTLINTLCQNCEEYVFLDTLRYLAAGGRVSKIRGLAGGLLGLKPIISPQQEGVRSMGVVRSQSGQKDFALERMRTLAKRSRVPLVLLQYSDNEDWLQQEVLPLVQELLPSSEILLLPLSLTSGVHMGPGTWALAACPQPTGTETMEI